MTLNDLAVWAVASLVVGGWLVIFFECAREDHRRAQAKERERKRLECEALRCAAVKPSSLDAVA